MLTTCIDFETHIGRRGEFFPRIVCAGVGTATERRLVTGARECALLLTRLCADPDVLVINQYVAYDICCALEELKDFPEYIRVIFNALRDGRVVGLDIAQMLLDVADGSMRASEDSGEAYSLPSIEAIHRLGDGSAKSDEWRVHFGGLEGVPAHLYPPEATEYVMGDVTKPIQIMERILVRNQEWVNRYGYPVLHLAPENTWSQVSLQLAAAHGTRVCPERHARVDRLVTTHQKRLLALLSAPAADGLDAGLVKPGSELGKGKDTKAAKARMVSVCAKAGRAVVMTEAKRGRKSLKPFVPQVSLEEDSCILSGDERLMAYSEYASAANLRSRVEDLRHGFDGPIQTSFRPIVATGRTSSRKPFSPHFGVQQQNWHKGKVSWEVGGKDITFNLGLREVQKPREGCAYVWADFEAAEMHALAQAGKDEVGFSRLGDLLNAHVDPHAYFAGVARLGLKGTPKEIADAVLARPDAKELRGWAKPFNFGKGGGMGHDKFRIFSRKQYGVIFTDEEARHYDKLWFEEFPEVRGLHQIVKRLLGRNETCTIRLKRGGMVLGGKRFTAASNSFFQAPTACGAKAALNHTSYDCFAESCSPVYGSRVWNFVHDEIALETPLELVHPAGVRLGEIMVEHFNVYTPDYPTDVEIMAGNAWSKEAERCLNEKNELVPWIYENSKSYRKMLEAEQLALAA